MEPPADPGMRGLLEVIDRLEALLDGSDLDEVEVEVGETSLLLRKPSALRSAPVAEAPAPTEPVASKGPSEGTRDEDEGRGRHAILAPLTGIFYHAPSPGAAPYVRVGAEVLKGQVIGLIEAMKLFNEIKSDASGRVARIVAESGTVVKQKQPLIEIEPA